MTTTHSVSSLAEFWGVHPGTIRLMIGDGELAAFNIGSSAKPVYRIPDEARIEFEQQNAAGRTKPKKRPKAKVKKFV